MIRADGEDVSVVTVEALDDRGRQVPVADDLIRFDLHGNGMIIGVGNGDPSSHEADKYLSGQYQRHLFNGVCQVIVQSSKEPGAIALRAFSGGLKPATIEVRSEPSPSRR